MNAVDDIPGLFKQFDGDAANYKEIVQTSHAEQAKARWPLIAAISASSFESPPPCVDIPSATATATATAAAEPGLATIDRPAQAARVAHSTSTSILPPRTSFLSSVARILGWSSRQPRA